MEVLIRTKGRNPKQTMEMIRMKEQKTKVGILKYIAGTGARGVKFEDQPETWYNPASDEAKAMVNDDFKGKRVEITLTEGKKTQFDSMVLLEIKQEEHPVATEESFDAESVQQVSQNMEVKHIKEEKVPPQTPPPKEEGPVTAQDDGDDQIEAKATESFMDQLRYGTSPIENMLKAAAGAALAQEYTKEDYKEMEGTELETATKGPNKLTYASWAEAWGALKRIHPTAQFHVHENKEGMPLFYNKEQPDMGAFVKVTVKVKGLEHTVHLPVMNNYNKSMKVEEITTFDINKSIMRCLVKCVALHGIGLYVFKGEDLKDLE